MSERSWIPLKSDDKWVGGFCRILRECLEAAGVEVDQVCYEGKTMGPLDQSSTFLTLTVPEDPRVPEFKEVKVHCFESSTMEAHHVCARWALKEVCNQLSGRLKDTPFSILLTTVYDPSRWDTYDAKYLEVTTEVVDKNLHMANQCILGRIKHCTWQTARLSS
jgi:hypothetical protein